jgi:tRNA (guanine-N(7)-)-methyltransferase subunit TRM82
MQSVGGLEYCWLFQKLRCQNEQEDEPQEPPGKRIKLSPPKEQKSNFANLVLSSDGQYLVGVTGEDKCIRVFQIDAQSRLHQLSER